MTLRDLVNSWNTTWHYDYWWRQKHNIPFNSDRHREVTQLDIAFEYHEYHMAKKAVDQLKEDEEKKKRIELGIWISKTVDDKKEDELFKKVDLSSF